MATVQRYIIDTSVVIDGRVTSEVRDGRFDGATLIVPEAVLHELEAQAANGQETGYTGLSELKELGTLAGRRDVELLREGEAPRARPGYGLTAEVDDLVRRLARGAEAVLVTSDPLQILSAEARGIPVLSFERLTGDRVERLELLRYFDDETMSVHLRTGSRPRAKKGSPGHRELVYLSDTPIARDEIETVAREIVEVAEQHPDGFIESDAGGSTVVQLTNLRIAIARPPFADAMEITATRPVARTALEDYGFVELLRERFAQRHRGVLVAGAPGAGKSTFVQAVADHLEEVGWVIKTMEKPRDLEVSDEITQYTALEGEMANTADVLLLVRPDYTVFDEVRRTDDFMVFADMRLAGVGMIGVVHATRGIDALQRLIGRVELGMIPQVVDTVVFLDAGDVREIYEIEFTVKLPTGLGDVGLARPVIEVRDHETKRLAYEIYTFGEQVVVMPMEELEVENPIWRLAERTLRHDIGRKVRGEVDVRIISDNQAAVYVEEHQIARVVGRGGANIRELEAQVGLGLDVRPLEERELESGRELDISVDAANVTLDFGRGMAGELVEVTVGDELVFTGGISKHGTVTLRRGTDPAEDIAQAKARGWPIRAQIAG